MRNEIEGDPLMEQSVHFRLQRWSAWSGFLVLVAMLIAYGIGDLLSPMSPTMSQGEVVDFLIKNQHGILICVAIMVLTVPFEYPYVVVTSMQMKRVEGGWGWLSMVQLTTGVVAPTGFFYPLAILAAAAYRPESHSPDVLSAMTDIFWLMYVGNACIFVLQVWSIGLASYLDKRAKPIFPRWYAHLSMLLGVLLIPGAFVFLNKTGPLAWNGILAQGLPALAYLVWKIATPLVLLKAIKGEEAELAEKAASEAEPANS
ncbi:hypothetical protein OG874_15085 [Nocardia sp. NBC_00565]|uniref:hypothetical protein n=1 Tax=Nocardia sp. NBC_00565 TaxID=2975993 RepID=UPI002E80E262|nr:hypothetical protein [Nocardia sp. NBC_00565]WUC06375.1 hypothetical protein OG874_15085 [Nocardia sp. NBC_00565]